MCITLFCTFLCRHCMRDYDVKMPNFKFYRRRKQATTFFFLFFLLCAVPKILLGFTLELLRTM